MRLQNIFLVFIKSSEISILRFFSQILIFFFFIYSANTYIESLMLMSRMKTEQSREGELEIER